MGRGQSQQVADSSAILYGSWQRRLCQDLSAANLEYLPDWWPKAFAAPFDVLDRLELEKGCFQMRDFIGAKDWMVKSPMFPEGWKTGGWLEQSRQQAEAFVGYVEKRIDPTSFQKCDFQCNVNQIMPVLKGGSLKKKYTEVPDIDTFTMVQLAAVEALSPSSGQWHIVLYDRLTASKYVYMDADYQLLGVVNIVKR